MLPLFIYTLLVLVGLVGWLLIDKYKPKPADYWRRADRMLSRWQADDKDRWDREYDAENYWKRQR